LPKRNRRKLVSVVTELRIVGGDPALDLVNTLGDDRVPDPLDDYAAFAGWAARVGAIDNSAAGRLSARADDHPAAAERALAEARALRDTMNAVFRPLASAIDPPPSAVARLVACAGAAVEQARLVPAGDAVARSRSGAAAGSFVLAWGSHHLERPLWPLALAGIDLLRSGPLDRLKACEGCPWLFLDTSRNHSRRWCSMDECGSRDKMRRYRARNATAGR
jgi:predicted RNA-binding Zn ribbon-like protein